MRDTLFGDTLQRANLKPLSYCQPVKNRREVFNERRRKRIARHLSLLPDSLIVVFFSLAVNNCWEISRAKKSYSSLVLLLNRQNWKGYFSSLVNECGRTFDNDGRMIRMLNIFYIRDESKKYKNYKNHDVRTNFVLISCLSSVWISNFENTAAPSTNQGQDYNVCVPNRGLPLDG